MKILIVRFSSIGDIVLTTPIVKAVKEQLQHVEIHYLTKKSFASLLHDNPAISKIYTIEKSINEITNQLKVEKYDYIIDLHKNIRTLRLKIKLGVPNFSFDKLNIHKWLLVNFKINRMPHLHIVDRYFGAVEKLGVKNDGSHCNVMLNSKDVVDVKSTLNVTPKDYLAVAIGAQFATKTMPIELMTKILNPIDKPIVLLGGKTDCERGETLTKQLQTAGCTVINAVNQFSLMQSASIVAQAKAILTHDTGLMHIATAFDIPIISVWGNTVPDLGMYPYYPNNKELYAIHEVNNLACRPCSKIGFKACPKKHFNCMNLQDAQAITNDIRNRLNN